MSKISFGFSVFGNRFYFTPKFTWVWLLIIIGLLSAGVWQLKMLTYAQQRVQRINDGLKLNPISYNDLDKPQDLRYTPIMMEGSFDNDHTILVSDHSFKGQAGYEVLTPFKSPTSATAILVNRGWVPENQISDLDAPTEAVTVTGILIMPYNHFSFYSAFDEKRVKWPLSIRYIDTEMIAKAVGYPLYSYVVLLSPSSQYGFVRQWLTKFTAEHGRSNYQAYALQCFVLALAAFLAFIFINTQRD